MTGFIHLLSKRMKTHYYIALCLLLFIIYTFFDPYFGEWITFLRIHSCCCIIYFGCDRRLLDVILSLTGYLIAVILNHIFYIVMSLLGLPLLFICDTAIYNIISSLFLTITTALVLSVVKKRFLRPRLAILMTCHDRFLRLFLTVLLIGIELIALNFVYGESVSYPTEVLSMTGLIASVFTLSAVLIFYSMYGILKQNHELTLQQAQMESMQDYMKHIESLYDEIRSFRHDYKNILSSMQCYIDADDIDALRIYFYETILPGAGTLSNSGFFLGRLRLVDDLAVKSILYTKFIYILNHRLSFTLELTEPVPPVFMDSLTLCRILGILLDNATEAAIESEEKRILFAIICEEKQISFLTENSTQPLSVPLSQLEEQGYTTKPGHDGLGLAVLKSLLDPLFQASLYTECHDGIFRQTLNIQKG